MGFSLCTKDPAFPHALRSGCISLSDIVPGHKETMTEESFPDTVIIIKGQRNVLQCLEWCFCIV